MLITLKKKREQRSYERVRKTYMSKPTVIHHFVSPQALASLQNSPLSSSPLRSYNESLQFFSSPSTVSHNFNATDPLIDSRNHPPLQVPSHLLSQKPFQYHMPLNQLPNPFSNMRPPLQIPVPGVIQHSISLSAQQQTIPSIRQIHFPPTSEPYSNFNKNFASIVSSANGNDNDPKKANNLTDLVEVLGEKKPR